MADIDLNEDKEIDVNAKKLSIVGKVNANQADFDYTGDIRALVVLFDQNNRSIRSDLTVLDKG